MRLWSQDQLNIDTLPSTYYRNTIWNIAYSLGVTVASVNNGSFGFNGAPVLWTIEPPLENVVAWCSPTVLDMSYRDLEPIRRVGWWR